MPLATEPSAALQEDSHPSSDALPPGQAYELAKGGARDLPERQRTLRGAIDWSHDLLGEDERVFFRRASVFVGGFALEAAEEVCDADGGLELVVLDGVESLLDKSLLRRPEEEAEEEPRFYMLETIREYATERLEESGEAEAGEVPARRALTWGWRRRPSSSSRGPDQLEWFDRLEAEHDNLRAALSWASGHEEAELGLGLAGALWWFWLVRGHVSEGRRWLEGSVGTE